MTLIDAGTMKVTRRVLPMIVVTEVALVVTADPPAVGVTETTVLAGEIVPDGKPEPVTFTTVTPA